MIIALCHISTICPLIEGGGGECGARRSHVLLVSGTPIAKGQCLHLTEDGGGGARRSHMCSLFLGHPLLRVSAYLSWRMVGCRRSHVLLVSGKPIATGQCLPLIEDGGGQMVRCAPCFPDTNCYGSVPTSHRGWWGADGQMCSLFPGHQLLWLSVYLSRRMSVVSPGPVLLLVLVVSVLIVSGCWYLDCLL